eukprot:4601094-Amphidinium_carterae.2
MSPTVAGKRAGCAAFVTFPTHKNKKSSAKRCVCNTDTTKWCRLDLCLAFPGMFCVELGRVCGWWILSQRQGCDSCGAQSLYLV